MILQPNFAVVRFLFDVETMMRTLVCYWRSPES